MIDWLLTPDGFPSDPRGYALNQIGHMALGAALAWLIGLPLTLLACIAWEAVHVRRGGHLWDSFEDFAFVLTGALAPVSLGAAAVAAPMLASGLLRRSP